jgi:hypothetical protein
VPTPIIAPVMVCVVETGIPNPVAKRRFSHRPLVALT